MAVFHTNAVAAELPSGAVQQFARFGKIARGMRQRRIVRPAFRKNVAGCSNINTKIYRARQRIPVDCGSSGATHGKIAKRCEARIERNLFELLKWLGANANAIGVAELTI